MLGWAKGQLRRKRFEFSCNKKTTVQSVAFSIISWLGVSLAEGTPRYPILSFSLRNWSGLGLFTVMAR
jgi:hypothetical protein